MSERIKHILNVYENVVKLTGDFIENSPEEANGDSTVISADQFDEILNKAISDEAINAAVEESTVRAALTRDIDKSTEIMKKAIKDYISKSNVDLENIICNNALTAKDNKDNVLKELRSIY